MWLIVGQLPIKAEWRDTSLAPWEFSRINKQKLSANVVISLHWHPYLHQSTLPIISCDAKLVSSSQLFSYKRLFRNRLRGFMSNGFCVFICLIICSLTSEVLLASENDFGNFFSVSLLISFVSLWKDVCSISFQCIFLLNISFWTWWRKKEWRV